MNLIIIKDKPHDTVNKTNKQKKVEKLKLNLLIKVCYSLQGFHCCDLKKMSNKICIKYAKN